MHKGRFVGINGSVFGMSGLRPIGVGEVLRRIIGKAIITTFRENIVDSVGSLKVCASHESGCEAAVHAMHREIF